MFEPFGQHIRIPKADSDAGVVGGRLYSAAIWAFWLLVVAIVVARAIFVVNGSLFAFAS